MDRVTEDGGGGNEKSRILGCLRFIIKKSFVY